MVITEVMADPTGSDTGRQYLEIYNNTGESIDLIGLSLFQSMADGSRENATTLKSALVLPQGYYVLGDAGSDAQARPAYLSYGYGSEIGALRHDNAKLGLRCASALLVEVNYGQVASGRARELDGAEPPNVPSALSSASWCDATEPLDALLPPGENFGSPGAPNPPCGQTRDLRTDGGLAAVRSDITEHSTDPIETEPANAACFDVATGSRRPIQGPKPGELLLTEVMPAPSMNNNGAGEWFEVLATRSLDLNGLVLENESADSTVLGGDTCLHVIAGDWLLFVRSGESTQNGGLPTATALFDFTLADAASAAYSERAVSLRTAESLIDRVTWSKSTKGSAWQRSASSLSPGATPDWCPTESTSVSGEHGTPGAVNAICPQSLDAGTQTTVTKPASGGTGGTLTSSVDATGGRSTTATGGTSSLSPVGGAFGAGGVGAVVTTLARDAGVGGLPFLADAAVTEPPQGGAGGAPTNTGASAVIAGPVCSDLDGLARASIAPQAGDLTITEVMSAPSANNNGAAEWFEVAVNADVDLNEVEFANEGSGRLVLSSERCLRVRSGERLLFARGPEFEQNGGLPFLSGTFDFTLADSASESHPQRLLVLRHSGVVLSRVEWTKSTKGASWQRSESTTASSDGGMALEDASTEASERWCVTPASVKFGLGDRGTPGYANQACE